MADWLSCWLADGLACVAGWLACFTGWLACWLADGLTCVAGWLAC